MNSAADPRGLAETDERSVGELFKQLALDTGVLVRKEVDLAKTEMTSKAKSAAKDGALIAAGGVLAFYASLVLVSAVVFALAMVMPLWASALLVGALLALGAGVLAVAGVKKLKSVDAKPHETIRTMKENQLWLREQMAR